MGTISNSLASSPVTTSSSSSSGSTGSSTSSSSNPNNIFMGSSSYSQDFQQVINRAVAIASLPINILTNQQNALTTQSSDLNNLDAQFTKLQTAVQNIGDALGGSNFNSTISQPDAVSASIGNGAVEGDYTINVTSIGAYATSLTNQAWNAVPDASGSPATYTLMVGGKGYSFTPADNSAASVAAAINSRYSGMVQAMAVNVGTVGTPDWRISLQSTTLGPVNLDIQGPPGGLQEQQAAVNGYSTSQTSAAWDSSLDPSGNPATYNLIIGSKSYAITPADDNIQTVVDAINNSSYGSQVTAAVVDGPGGSSDPRIQLTSTSTTPVTLDLQRQAPSLQTQPPVLNGDGFAVSQTASPWDSTADAMGDPNAYHLIVGSKSYSVTPSDNSAQSVVDAINSQYGSLVTAEVVPGSGGDSDSRIQLTSRTAGAMTLDLQKMSSLQGSQVTGALASYEVLNSGKTVSSNTRTVTVAQGVNLTLLAPSKGSLDVTVTQSTTALNNAISAFADAYNATVDMINAQHGQSAGSLQGQAILSTLSQALSSISTYGSAGGGISTLESLGLKSDIAGHLTYDAGTLMGNEFGNTQGILSFLGSATGGGFLKTATDALTSLEGSATVTGSLKTAEKNIQTQLTTLASNISDKQAKVQQFQLNLQNQMAASDALIASMQQQYSYLSALFSSEQTDAQMNK